MAHADAFETADIAAFNGRNNPEHFFWGEIAQQLGKGEQFRTSGPAARRPRTKKTGSSCSRATTPSSSCSTRCRPYFHYLDTQKVGNGTVADIATRAFANLLTAAGKKSNVCVVVSDLAAAYDDRRPAHQPRPEDARSELGRQERNITPVDLAANEIYDILRKRLFSPLAGQGGDRGHRRCLRPQA